MAKRANPDLPRYGVVGAEQRLLELAAEAPVIFAMFRELRAMATPLWWIGLAVSVPLPRSG